MAFTVTFPTNPPDAMLFEIVPGTWYQYNKSSLAWLLLDGYTAIGPATPADDGLMAAADYRKLMGLIVPPPIIRLKPDSCTVQFDAGFIDVKSSDAFLKVETDINLSTDGAQSRVVWNIVKDVYGINCTLDLPALLAEIQRRGNLVIRQKVGEDGDKGERGDPGLDALDTGPVGEVGAAGKNAPFGGIVTEDPIPVERVGDLNLAIVDISAQDDGKTGKLVLTRANVGNPLACPTEVVPQPLMSPWLVVMDGAPEDVTYTQEPGSDCKYSCKICVKLKFLYIDPILQAIDQRYQDLVHELKEQKEAIVSSWLKTMVDLFNRQKAAVCCALENYTTAKRNAEARERLEMLAIEAAKIPFDKAGKSLVITPRLDAGPLSAQQSFDAIDKPCIAPTPGHRNNDPLNCRQCLAEFVVDGKKNISPDTAVVVDLDSDHYTAEITGCCVNRTVNTGRYTGRVGIQYAGKDGVMAEYFPDLGEYKTNADAAAAYVGLTLSFRHLGGQIKMWVDDVFGDDNAGEVFVCVKRSHCFESTDVDLTSGHVIEDVINAYLDGTGPENQLGAGLPYLGSIDAATNYALGAHPGGSPICLPTETSCDDAGPNPMFGPVLTRNELIIFFYDGPDGLSMFLVMNKKNDDIQKTVRLQLSIDGNVHPVNILAHNAAGEFSKLSNKFTGDFSYPDVLTTVHGKGAVIGFLDKVDPAWTISLKCLDLGNIQRLLFASSNGTVISLAETNADDADLPALPPGTPGIGDSLKNNTYYFRSSGPSCLMEASQLDWYIRGLRIEACCAAIVTYAGAPWAVIKRSIGPDGTCGGGESENSDCVKKFLAARGHPSIAWPVIMPSREGIGLPTSGFVEFVEDKVLEQAFLTLIRSGSVLYQHGELDEHQVIIFPKIF